MPAPKISCSALCFSRRSSPSRLTFLLKGIENHKNGNQAFVYRNVLSSELNFCDASSHCFQHRIGTVGILTKYFTPFETVLFQRKRHTFECIFTIFRIDIIHCNMIQTLYLIFRRLGTTHLILKSKRRDFSKLLKSQEISYRGEFVMRTKHFSHMCGGCLFEHFLFCFVSFE